MKQCSHPRDGRAHVWRHFPLSWQGGGCDRHLVGRNQGHSKPSCMPKKERLSPQISIMLRLRKDLMHVRSCTLEAWLVPGYGTSSKHKASEIPNDCGLNAIGVQKCLSLPGSIKWEDPYFQTGCLIAGKKQVFIHTSRIKFSGRHWELTNALGKEERGKEGGSFGDREAGMVPSRDGWVDQLSMEWMHFICLFWPRVPCLRVNGWREQVHGQPSLEHEPTCWPGTQD